MGRTAHPPDDDAARRPDRGNAFAVLYIPRLGTDYQRVVLEGTGEKQLSQGPGHYAGRRCRVSRATSGSPGTGSARARPSCDLDQLRPGDPIVVETVDSWFVYRVLGDVATGDLDRRPERDPRPGDRPPRPTSRCSPRRPDGPEDAAPTGSYLTLTTCHPRYSARQRLVIHAALDGGGDRKAERRTARPR